MRAPARGLLVRLWTRCFPQIRLLSALALFIASTVAAHAQSSDWTGRVDNNWFIFGNWSPVGIPAEFSRVTIDTVSPNSTEIPPGFNATALNLTVGQAGIGALTIQNGGTLTNIGGFLGNLPGSQGTVTVTGAGSKWTNLGNLLVGSQGKGTLTIENGGTLNSGGETVVGFSGQRDWRRDGDWARLRLEPQRWRVHYRQLGHGLACDSERWEGHQQHRLPCQRWPCWRRTRYGDR